MSSTPSPLLTRPARVPVPVLQQLQVWVRAVLDLPEDAHVSVVQLTCPDRGCAPIETVLTVLRPGASWSRTLPLPADRVCAADVLSAFDRRDQP